ASLRFNPTVSSASPPRVPLTARSSVPGTWRSLMKILSVVGARPQFVKLAAIADAAAQRDDVEHVIVHTGQHYDAAMSDVFFADLRIPAPDVNLAIGSGSHGRQTGAMLAGMDEVLEEHQPDWTL